MSGGNGAVFRAFMSTCSDMFSDVAENPAFRRMAQLFERVDALVVGLKEINRHLYRIAEMDLAQIAHMSLSRKGRAVALLHVVGTDPEFEPHLVDAAVEQHVVVSHVEMAIVVDPLRLDLHHGGQEWRGRMLRRIVFRKRRCRHLNSRFGRQCLLTRYISFATVRATTASFEVSGRGLFQCSFDTSGAVRDRERHRSAGRAVRQQSHHLAGRCASSTPIPPPGCRRSRPTRW